MISYHQINDKNSPWSTDTALNEVRNQRELCQLDKKGSSKFTVAHFCLIYLINSAQPKAGCPTPNTGRKQDDPLSYTSKLEGKASEFIQKIKSKAGNKKHVFICR